MSIDATRKHLDICLEALALCDARVHSAERTGAKSRLKELKGDQDKAAHSVQMAEEALRVATEAEAKARREAEAICETATGSLAELSRELNEKLEAHILGTLNPLREYFEKSKALCVEGEALAREFHRACRILGRSAGGASGPSTRLVDANCTFKHFLDRLILFLSRGDIEERNGVFSWYRMDGTGRTISQSPPRLPAKKTLTDEEIRSSSLFGLVRNPMGGEK